MKRARKRQQAWRFVGLVGASALAAASASASKADLSRCAGIDAADARLACYDALAGRVAAPARAAPAARTSQPASTDAESQAQPAESKGFGLPPPVQALPASPQRIEARVIKVAASRFGAASVELNNGQTWALDESNGELAAGDAVVIKRAALGSYLMMTPAKRSIRVRRLQ